MITSRRSLFGFGAALIAAPAIVRVASIMPVSARYDTRRWLPYNATVPSLTLADVRRIKKDLQMRWAASIAGRVDVGNGVALCIGCHREQHKNMGAALWR